MKPHRILTAMIVISSLIVGSSCQKSSAPTEVTTSPSPTETAQPDVSVDIEPVTTEEEPKKVELKETTENTIVESSSPPDLQNKQYSTIERVSDLNDPALTEVDNILRSSDTDEAITKIEAISAQRDNTDPAKGVMELRLAYLNYRKGNKTASQNHFGRIVYAEVLAPKETVIEAAGRLSKMCYGTGDKKGALSANQVLVNNADITNKHRSTALKEIGEAMVEQSKEGEVAYEETRQFLVQALKEVPKGHRECRSALGALYLETLYDSQQYRQCIRDASLYLDLKNMQQHDRGIALLFMGLAHHQVGENGLAKQALADCMDLNASANQPELHAQAEQWLKTIEERELEGKKILTRN